ncbi:glycosyltransferase family 4 protein [Ilumatobacter sp.]|uniref:glycosyltransferase family 4 protein n=1 Tax=Ilumatobacter sp. TaxID=1967498 RepID=UPI003B51D75E
MRVLLVNDYGTASGGAEIQMLRIRELLRERGHQVRLLTSDARLVEGFDVAADVAARGRTDLGQVLTQTINPSAWHHLGAELDRHPPDVVHVRMFLWQLSPLVLRRLADVPVLYQAAVYKAVCPTGLKMLPDGTPCTARPGAVCRREGCVAPATWVSTMAQLRLLRRWRDRIDHTAVLSERMRRIFDAEGWTGASVLGNGVDLGVVTRPLPEAPLVGYAGRLAPEKGVETLIDAFADVLRDIPDARLLIAGSGPSEGELRDRARPVGDRIRFLGHLGRAEMEGAFAPVWVQAVPSIWHEPFGNVTTEAMARGTAVVASDVGGQSDLVHDSVTGHLVEPGDRGALADALASILSDRSVAERLGDAGREVAESQHAWGPVVDRLEALYATTIERHRRPGATTTAGDLR